MDKIFCALCGVVLSRYESHAPPSGRKLPWNFEMRRVSRLAEKSVLSPLRAPLCTINWLSLTDRLAATPGTLVVLRPQYDQPPELYGVGILIFWFIFWASKDATKSYTDEESSVEAHDFSRRPTEISSMVLVHDACWRLLLARLAAEYVQGTALRQPDPLLFITCGSKSIPYPALLPS